jgi:hypothetical protein
MPSRNRTLHLQFARHRPDEERGSMAVPLLLDLQLSSSAGQLLEDGLHPEPILSSTFWI